MRRHLVLWMTVVGLLGPLPVLLAPPLAGAGSVHAPVRMPNVIHFDRATTFAAMAQAGLYFRTNGPRDWNEVIAEHPPPGTLVPWGSTVVLATSVATVSPASGETVVPDVLYRTRAETFAAMAQAGLYFSTRGPVDWTIVVAQRPRPGSRVPVRSTVAVVTAHVALSSPSGMTVMPDVVHRSRTAAFNAMASAGLYFTVNGPLNWTVVVAQNPRPGTRVAWHGTVVLAGAHVVAPSNTVRVPTLIGLDRARVLADVSSLGLRLHPQGVGSANGTWDRVTAQNPAPGTLVRRGTLVIVDTTRVAVVTTTTAVGAPTATAPPTTLHALTHDRIGVATWYAYIPGQCATSYLPKGTRITVQDLATGRIVQCVVTDYQDYSPGRIVDLAETQFAELAPLWRGVIEVKVSW